MINKIYSDSASNSNVSSDIIKYMRHMIIKPKSA